MFNFAYLAAIVKSWMGALEPLFLYMGNTN